MFYIIELAISLNWPFLMQFGLDSVATRNTGFYMSLWTCKNTGSAYLLNLAVFLLRNLWFGSVATRNTGFRMALWLC